MNDIYNIYDANGTGGVLSRLPRGGDIDGAARATVEMPVQLALMIARDERAFGAFTALSVERQNEYIRRARRAVGSAEMRHVVDDIIRIG